MKCRGQEDAKGKCHKREQQAETEDRIGSLIKIDQVGGSADHPPPFGLILRIGQLPANSLGCSEDPSCTT